MWGRQNKTTDCFCLRPASVAVGSFHPPLNLQRRKQVKCLAEEDVATMWGERLLERKRKAWAHLLTPSVFPQRPTSQLSLGSIHFKSTLLSHVLLTLCSLYLTVPFKNFGSCCLAGVGFSNRISCSSIWAQTHLTMSKRLTLNSSSSCLYLSARMASLHLPRLEVPGLLLYPHLKHITWAIATTRLNETPLLFPV